MKTAASSRNFSSQDQIKSVAELNSLQLIFNTNLRIFMKSPDGDAPTLIKQYRQLRGARLKLSPELSVKTVSISDIFDSGLAKKDFAYRIVRLMRDQAASVHEFIHSFVVHGSYATRDFIPMWSDLDTMIVLKDSVFDSVTNLQRVKKVFLKLGLLCYWIDPLAHHQLSFITEFDLSYYPQSFLPLPSYEQALLLLGTGQIHFDVRDDTSEQAAVFEKFTEHFRRKVKNGNWSRNQYDWKNDLAHAFLSPSLLLQTRGVYVYKRESFLKVKQVLNDFDARSLDQATDIMRKWEVSNFVKYLPARLIVSLPYWLSRIIVAIARKPALLKRPAQSLIEIERLTREFLHLYEYKK